LVGAFRCKRALFKPLTKATFDLRSDKVGTTLAKAIQIATSEPPGPVHLDFPEDVAVSKAAKVSDPQCRTRKLSDLSGEIVGVVSHALRSARRPLLVTGLTFARSQAPLRLLDFIERQIPFVPTLPRRGFLPEAPSQLGRRYRPRPAPRQAFTDRADLIIAVAFSLSKSTRNGSVRYR
jgi:acetolactate synthase-1/2/3 large subunit